MPDNPSLNKRVLVAGALGVVLGFLAGFFLANGINREEQEKLRGELAAARAGREGAQGGGAGKAQTASAQGGGDDSFPTLTDEQLGNAVKQADADPSNAELQHKVGQALYFYAWEKGNAQILPDVARILKRAHALDPKNYRTTVVAGDAHFLIASRSGDAATLGEARKFYEAALAAQPDDAQVRTNLGRTYFFDRPPNPQRAIGEYRRALQKDPRQELTLQSLAAALIETGGLDEAARRLDELGKVNPSNAELPGLRAQLEQKRNAAKEKP
ncbi:MAG TPA: tetratricopeptide repeat protein [Pyrinomonadaceae bacterium]|jgi:tetratricopeptide (TPR) repeat protein